MNEQLVPLILGMMVFSIPILAIVLKSSVGKALAHYLEKKAQSSAHELEGMLKSENLLLDISERLLNVEQELNQLRQSHEKMQQVLLKTHDPKQLGP
ncbi:hypothetical protein JXQ70_13250 [bacterium]|nr:hypothetical protein [bacterium]